MSAAVASDLQLSTTCPISTLPGDGERYFGNMWAEHRLIWGSAQNWANELAPAAADDPATG